MIYVSIPPKGNTQGVIHLSSNGAVEDCATKPAGYRERGGTVGDPKAEDLLAVRLASRSFRRCRKCFKYGPMYGRGGC